MAIFWKFLKSFIIYILFVLNIYEELFNLLTKKKPHNLSKLTSLFLLDNLFNMYNLILLNIYTVKFYKLFLQTFENIKMYQRTQSLKLYTQ